MATPDRRRFLGAGLAGAMALLALPVLAKVPASSIPTQDLVQPADLVAQLKSATQPKPLVLHVGFRKLYAQAHIPGSDYAGPGGDDDGLKALSERVEKVPRDSAIVIYCGCCPWSKCPNIAAAYDRLRDLGFTRVKALYLPEDFGTDWVDKGYPTDASP